MLKKILNLFNTKSLNQVKIENLDEDFIPIENPDFRLNKFPRDKIQTIFLNIVFRYVLDDIFIILNARIKECKEAVNLDEDDLKLKFHQRKEIERLLNVERVEFPVLAQQLYFGELKKATSLIVGKNYLYSCHKEDLQQFYVDNQSTILFKTNAHIRFVRKVLLDKIAKELSVNNDFIGGDVTEMTKPFDDKEDLHFVDGKSTDTKTEDKSDDKTKENGTSKKKIYFKN